MSTPIPEGIAGWWTPVETAEFLGLSVKTLAKWRSLSEHPELAYVKYVGRVLYDPDAVRRWFRNQLKPRTSTHVEDCTRHKTRSRTHA